jgi:D-hydroxyproline dehydrogenase subunit gamma
MFARQPDLIADRDVVGIVVDGVVVAARVGDTVAAAMLAAGWSCNRTTPVTGAPRGPFCLMGVCFECLVTIDGRASQQACLVTVAPGMRVDTQQGARALVAAVEDPA